MAEAGLTDFLQQLPSFIIFMFCASVSALGVSLVLIINARRQKAAKARAATMNAPAGAMTLMSYQPSDMPDLDALLQGTPTPAPARAARGGTQTITLQDGSSADVVELVSIMRDITDGGLIVQMHGKTFRVASSMGDSDFRHKLAGILKEVAQAASGGVAAREPAMPAPPAAAMPPRPSAAAPTSAAFDLPKFDIESSSMPMNRRELKKAANAPIPQIDIAGAIEAFLQHKLATTGAFAGRSLHVRPTGDGGIRIQVDNTYYEAVDDVADADVRAFLQATIEEWQARQ
jgi:hypothetical protein